MKQVKLKKNYTNMKIKIKGILKEEVEKKTSEHVQNMVTPFSN